MEKEIIHAFLNYKYRPMSDKSSASSILVIWVYSAFSAFIAHLLLKPNITRVSLCFALVFTIYTFIALSKENGKKTGNFIYNGVFASCFVVSNLILVYLLCFADGAEGNLTLPLLVVSILLPLSIISIPLSLLFIKRNIDKGKYKQSATQIGLSASFGVIGWFLAQAFFPYFNLSQSTALLVAIGLCASLMIGVTSFATREFYKYYLAKKYEIE